MRTACIVIFGLCALVAAAEPPDPETVGELRVRGGLPNLMAKLKAGGDVRIAYLGGSITMAEGWRVKTLEGFRSGYPQAKIIEINAAISGTGSGYGACRLAEHVLAHSPDLVFIEFRVNGGDGHEVQSVEGIVRQTWAKNPVTDICFVHTIAHTFLPQIRNGRNSGFGEALEKVANRYDIPSIDFGPEVVRREQTGMLVFQGDEAPAGKVLFAKDGTHPGKDGHQIYYEVVMRSLKAMEGCGSAGPHEIPPPLSDDPWDFARQVPVREATLSAGWTPVDLAKDPVIAAGGVRSSKMFPAALRCSGRGESITLRFTGTTAGLIDLPAPQEVVLAVSIDGRPPITVARKETYRKEQSMGRFFFLPDQPPGPHTVRLEIKKIPDGVSYYVGPLLIVGSK